MLSHDWYAGFSEKSSAELRAYIQKAHEQGMRVRFWNTPDDIGLWERLIDSGIDLLSTDRLSLLRLFLSGFPVRELPNTTWTSTAAPTSLTNHS